MIAAVRPRQRGAGRHATIPGADTLRQVSWPTWHALPSAGRGLRVPRCQRSSAVSRIPAAVPAASRLRERWPLLLPAQHCFQGSSRTCLGWSSRGWSARSRCVLCSQREALFGVASVLLHCFPQPASARQTCMQPGCRSSATLLWHFTV